MAAVKACKLAPDCDNYLSDRSKFDYCIGCRNRIEWAAQLPEGKREKRRMQLHKWTARVQIADQGYKRPPDAPAKHATSKTKHAKKSVTKSVTKTAAKKKANG